METRFSPEHFKRKEMMASLKVPTISEAKQHAGLPLSSVLFTETHPELLHDFGLEPLKSAQGDLWVSPSDLLIGKVALKPPFTQKHMQALTHKGILELGAHVEQKFLNEKHLEKLKAIAEREDYLMRMFEARKAELIENLRKEESDKYTERIDALTSFFDNKVAELLWQCFEQVKVLEEQMHVETDSLNFLWKEKLDQEIEETVTRLTEEFLEKMRKQERVLVEIYNKKLNNLEMKKKCAIDLERTKCEEMLVQMKHKLHCENITNLMYLLCKERRKCKMEKTQLEEDFLNQITEYKKSIKSKDREILKLKHLKNYKTKQVSVREKCLVEILKQFKKFIYFALKATPTQGEFLLNVEKLIKFELDDYCLPTSETKIETVRKKSEDEVHRNYTDMIEMYMKVTRACEDEEKENEIGASLALPAFYFNDKLYVREDFKDRLEAGVQIDKHHPLWNPDVEELIEVFKKVVHKKSCSSELGRVKSTHSNVRFGQKDAGECSPPSPIKISHPTVLVEKVETKTESPTRSITTESNMEPAMISKTSSLEEVDSEREIRKVSLGNDSRKFPISISRTSKASGTHSPRKQSLNDFDIRPQIKRNSLTQSRLTLARDSIILHISTIERKSIQYVSKLAEEELSTTTDIEKPVEPPPPTSMDLASSHGSLEKDAKRSTTSKLLLANDSYELIKSTINLCSDHRPDTENREKRKSQLTFSPKVQVEENIEKTKVTQKKTKAKQTHITKKPITKKVAKVVGKRKTKEHEKPINEFTNERIQSLVDLMKDNPSLLRLFTSCQK